MQDEYYCKSRAIVAVSVGNCTNSNSIFKIFIYSLIYGFSSKQDSERKLKSVKPFKPYTFLLRFSDHVITDGQGQNMCGAISTVFVYKTEEGRSKINLIFTTI